MKYRILFDGNQKLHLFSFENRKMAESYIKNAEVPLAVALYPSLCADIGACFLSRVWGRESTPEGLRAISCYFGICLGMPLEGVSVEAENEKIEAVPLIRKSKDELCIKTTVCKDKFENSVVFVKNESHPASLYSDKKKVIVIESAYPAAVDKTGIEALCMSGGAVHIPILLASLLKDTLHVRVIDPDAGEIKADDRMISIALSYLVKIGRAEEEREYLSDEGRYRVKGQRVSCIRRTYAL